MFTSISLSLKKNQVSFVYHILVPLLFNLSLSLSLSLSAFYILWLDIIAKLQLYCYVHFSDEYPWEQYKLHFYLRYEVK